MNFPIELQIALDALQSGRPILLTDDVARENEGDLIYLAEHIDATSVNFMATHGRGLICLALCPNLVDQLQLPLMTQNNQTSFNTPFTVSIEAKSGVTTGITAADRAHTMRSVVAVGATHHDYVSPGHVFPLRAHPHGVLGRAGHTEASVELAKLAGSRPAAVMCEVLNVDGDSARGDELTAFCELHRIPRLTIQCLIDYRLKQEILASEVVSAALPTNNAEAFEIAAFASILDEQDIVVLKHPNFDPKRPVLVRIHSECLTGDVFGSLKCDCGLQLQAALNMIAAEAGILIYLRQEGRGIGFVNKLKAYQLQAQGYDTVSANTALGLPTDQRHYLAAAHVLKALNITDVQLLTNNPHKISDLERCGLKVERRSLVSVANVHSQAYLSTKYAKLGHLA